MNRRWAIGLGTAVLSAWIGSAEAGEPEAITYLPRALPIKRLTPPVPGIAKATALHPPDNSVPAPVTTPPGFTPGSPSLCALAEPHGDGYSWCNPCATQCCQEKYYAGIGFYFIEPYWDSNPAYYAFNLGGGSQFDFRSDFELAPRAVIGCRACGGLGVRARGWFYDKDASEFLVDASDNVSFDTATPLGLGIRTLEDNAAAPQTLLIESDITLSQVDLEVTQDWEVGCWWMTFSTGGRYTHLSQDYKALHVGPGAVVLSRLNSSHSFNGAGLTCAIDGHRPLNFLGLALYGSGRGSLLYGGMEQIANVSGAVNAGATYAHQDLLPILELEAGIEWRGCVGPCELFLQTAIITQAWFGAGNASRSNAAQDEFRAFGRAGIDDGNLGFFGGTVMGGLRF